MPFVHHATNFRQELAVECLSGTQDESFFEAQLLRAISLALTTVGFDSVKPEALEAFRADVDRCMHREYLRVHPRLTLPHSYALLSQARP
jgi:hypothetical protein